MKTHGVNSIFIILIVFLLAIPFTAAGDTPGTKKAQQDAVSHETSGLADHEKAEKKARAEKLREKLVNGADFAKTAAESSDCPSKNEGGELGSFGRGRMAQEFENAAFSQEVGEIGPVIETRFGYHIILVEKHTPASRKTFEQGKDQIKNHLEQKNKNMVVREYIDGLKSTATIVYEKE